MLKDFTSVNECLTWIKKRNADFSEFFCQPDQSLARQVYRHHHPTEIMAFKCMDGRIHIPIMAEMPFGIVQPQRNLGGYFDLGWPLLGEVMVDWVNYSIKKQRRCLVLVTYHYSHNDQHRGCAGFDYKTEAAYQFSLEFRDQIERMFGVSHQMVCPVIIGIETDEDAFTLHHHNGAMKLTDCLDYTAAQIKQALRDFYPDFHHQIIDDLVPIVSGNISHIKKIRQSQRPVVEIEHKEWMIGLGQGFDWLHEPNIALIIGPHSPDLAEPLIKALGIIKSTIGKGKTPQDGFVMMTSTPFRYSAGIDKARAKEKAWFLARFAKKITQEHYPELAEIMRPLTVILNENTRKFEEI